MKKYILGIILAVLVIVVGIFVYKGQNKAVSPATLTVNASSIVAGWQTYKNVQYRFEFQYPKDWGELKITNSGTDQVGVGTTGAFSGGDFNPINGGLSFRVGTFYDRKKKGNSTVEEIVNFVNNSPDLQNVNKQQVYVGNRKVIKVEYILNGDVMTNIYVPLDSKDDIFVITSVKKVIDTDTFDTIAKSLKFF